MLFITKTRPHTIDFDHEIEYHSIFPDKKATMSNETKYQAVKAYIESGKMKSFTEIFDITTKNAIIKDSGINYVRITNKINNPEKFTVKDIIIIARLIGIESAKLYELIAAAAEKKVPVRKKRQ
jgi:hypothetical protein